MTRAQLIAIGSAVALLLALYFGCETKPRDMQAVEKSRALAAESASVNVLLNSARDRLDSRQQNVLMALEHQLEGTVDDSTRIEIYKQLSNRWYGFGHPAIAGHYAQEVAELAGTEESWAIAGTTYTLCLQQSQEEKVREFCTERAVQALESAVSLNPANLANKVNLAIVFVENPPEDNPMKGITMLIDLNRDNPGNVMVLNNLGRLAVKTGQYERAVERLEQALDVEPDNVTTNCLLAQAYGEMGELQKAQAFEEKCRKLQD